MAAEAFACQSTHIGWDNFLWGWIAKLWQDAYYQDCIEKQKWADKRDWASKVVQAVLQYSHLVWKFRCTLLHGRTAEEAQAKHLHGLRQDIAKAYTAFKNDPFIIKEDLHHIFLTPSLSLTKTGCG